MSAYEPYPSAAPQPYGPGYGAPTPARPAPVVTAVKLMYVGAAVQFIVAILGLTALSSIKATIKDRNTDLTASQLSTVTTVTVVVVIIAGAIYAGLWIWMAAKTGQGRSWARVLSTVFFALGALFLLVNLVTSSLESTPVWNRLLGLVPVLIGLVVIILLWRRESSGFFNAGRPGAAGGGYPGYPPA